MDGITNHQVQQEKFYGAQAAVLLLLILHLQVRMDFMVILVDN